MTSYSHIFSLDLIVRSVSEFANATSTTSESIDLVQVQLSPLFQAAYPLLHQHERRTQLQETCFLTPIWFLSAVRRTIPVLQLAWSVIEFIRMANFMLNIKREQLCHCHCNACRGMRVPRRLMLQHSAKIRRATSAQTGPSLASSGPRLVTVGTRPVSASLPTISEENPCTETTSGRAGSLSHDRYRETQSQVIFARTRTSSAPSRSAGHLQDIESPDEISFTSDQYSPPPAIIRQSPLHVSPPTLISTATRRTDQSPVTLSFRTEVRSSAPLIAEAEKRGLAHVRAVEEEEPRIDASDEVDDWELEDERGEDEEEPRGYAPAEGESVHQRVVPVTANDAMPDVEDAFQYAPSPTRAPPSAKDVHPNRAVYILYMLVFWMHCQFHLPFRACNAFLAVVGLAFDAAGVPLDPPIYTTLPSVIEHLDGNPSIYVCPVCPSCLQPYPTSTPADAYCQTSGCHHPLFRPAPSSSNKKHTSNRRPYLQFPTKSLEEQICDMLSIPGIEDEMDAWRKKERMPGKYTDIFDGDICKELPAHDGSQFFQYGKQELPDGELRIGVSLGVDW